jgi:hypothetical protein
MASKQDTSRRIKALVEYVQSVGNEILQEESKANIVVWLEWLNEGQDSSTMMRWFPVLRATFGYYLAALVEAIDRKRFLVDQVAARSRKALERNSASKVTEAAAKAHTMLYPGYDTVCSELAALERLHGFLHSVSSGVDPDVITAYGHNQRLEMRQDT